MNSLKHGVILFGCWSAVVLSGLMSPTGPNLARAGDCGDGDDDGNFFSYACGDGSVTWGEYSVSFGELSTAGSDATPSSHDSAIGYSANAFGESVAVGARARAGEDNQIAPNRYHTAIGTGAEAGLGINGLEYSTAVGYLAKANSSLATALGAGAEANFIGSTAIGVGAQSTRDNQVLFGHSGNTYSLAGVASDASKAAQAGTTYIVTTDAAGNLATSTFDVATLQALPARVAAAEQKNIAQDGRLTSIEQVNIQQNDRITQTEQKNVEQDNRLAGHENRIRNTETTVAGHTITLNQHTNQLADHETRITENTNVNNQQTRQITSLYSLTAEHTNQILDLDGRVTGNTNAIGALDTRVTELRATVFEGFERLDGRVDQAFEGAAMAMAMAGAGLPAEKNYALSINWGNFEGESAFAGTSQARLGENLLIHGGIGYGASTGSVGGRAGVTFAW